MTTKAIETLVELDLQEELDCEACGGLGWYDVGDCENGVIDVCPACDGDGKKREGL
jgi:hypothetical protein